MNLNFLKVYKKSCEQNNAIKIDDPVDCHNFSLSLFESSVAKSKEALRIYFEPKCDFISDTIKGKRGKLIRANKFFTMFQGKHQKKSVRSFFTSVRCSHSSSVLAKMTNTFIPTDKHTTYFFN